MMSLLLLLHVVELLLVLLKLVLVELLLLLLVLLLQLLLLLLVVLLKLLQVARVLLLLLLLLMLLELLLLLDLLLVELLLLLQMNLLLLLKLALHSTAGSLRGRLLLLLLPRGGLAHRRRRAELWRVAGRGTAAGHRAASTGPTRVGRSRWPRLLLGPLRSRAVAALRHAHREVLILLIILRFGRPIALKSRSSRPLACWLLL